MAPSPFSPESIKQAVSSALMQTPLPPGKKVAIVAMATPDGVKAVIAARVGDHWTVAGDVEYHGAGIEGGVSVVASW